MAESNNIKNLPRTRQFGPRDKIIIQNPRDGLQLLDYENIFITSNQINFLSEVENNYTGLLQLNDLNTLSIELLSSTAEELNIPRKVIHTFNTTSISSNGTIDDVDYVETIAADQQYRGPNNRVFLTDNAVNELQTSIDLEEEALIECDATSITLGEGTFSVPRGTYRIKSSLSLTPNQKLQNEECNYEPIRAFITLKQLTPPIRDLLAGSGGYTYGVVGKSITLNLNGYFYVDKKTELSLSLNVEGTLFPGIINSTFSSELSTFTSISEKFNKVEFRPAQTILEKISDSNTLSATEASANINRSQSFIMPPKSPLLYNAGWIYPIDNVSTRPDDSQMTIKYSPFTLYRGQQIGKYRGFVTDPNAHKGAVKEGDTVKYRSQLTTKVDSKTIVTENRASYDARDQGFIKLPTGWWGLLPSSSERGVGDMFDTVFYVDKNSVATNIIINRNLLSNTICPDGIDSSSPISVATRNTPVGRFNFSIASNKSFASNGETVSITANARSRDALKWIRDVGQSAVIFKLTTDDTTTISNFRSDNNDISVNYDGINIYITTNMQFGASDINFDVDYVYEDKDVFYTLVDSNGKKLTPELKLTLKPSTVL